MAEGNSEAKPLSEKVRYDWYQTETHVILNILHKKVDESKLITEYNSLRFKVSFPIENDEIYELNINLAHEIKPSECTVKVMASKVEVKLKKLEGFRWAKLEGDSTQTVTIKYAKLEPQGDAGNSAASKQGKNWDKVVTDITSTDDDKAEGEAALNELFQKIYSEGSDEVRKAMNKSFMESGGTVLSTNWSEVGKDKVDVKPPDGLEWKKWD